MKFHLSTLLLAMVIVALGLGWYLDHNDPRRTEIVGSWHFPYQAYPIGITGYYTTLRINEDGTFIKFEGGRYGGDTYEGKYHVEKDGLIDFHVTKKIIKLDLDDVLPRVSESMNKEPPPARRPETLDVRFKIRCAVDKAGYLILDNQTWRFEEDEVCKIKWNHSFERSK